MKILANSATLVKKLDNLFIHPWHEYYKTLLYLPKSDSLKAT